MTISPSRRGNRRGLKEVRGKGGYEKGSFGELFGFAKAVHMRWPSGCLAVPECGLSSGKRTG